MSENTLNCPACSATLRLAQEVPAGKKVKCPKCGIHFSPGEEAVVDAVVAEKPRPRNDDDDRPRRRRRDDDYDDYDDRPRRRQRAKPRSLVATLLILAAVILVPVVLLGGLFGAYKLLSKPDKGFKLPENAQKPPGANNPGQDPASQDQDKPKDPPKKAGPGEVGVDIGNLAPEIEGEDIDGKKFKLSDYRGKVVVLDFWGNW